MTITLIHERVRLARLGENPTVVCKMPSGWHVLGDHQYLPGYSLLLADPVVPTLNSLEGFSRARFLLDMTIIGDALLEVASASRINYEILGNQDHALHAHIFPRYANEPEDKRGFPPFIYHDTPNKVPFDESREAPLALQLKNLIESKLLQMNAA